MRGLHWATAQAADRGSNVRLDTVRIPRKLDGDEVGGLLEHTDRDSASEGRGGARGAAVLQRRGANSRATGRFA
jgi:hypothetical protein